MATYPAGTHTVGPGQFPYPDGSMTPFPPGDIQQLAARVNTISGSGIGYCATTAARDALVTNGDAFTGLVVYCADTALYWEYNGSGWGPWGRRIVQYEQMTIDCSTGTTLGAGGSAGSSLQTVVVPANANANVLMHVSAYMYLGSAATFAGYFHTYIDGGLDGYVSYAVRYHNHGRAGALNFTADWEFTLPAGSHSVGVQLREDSGSVSHELWDLQTAIWAKW